MRARHELTVGWCPARVCQTQRQSQFSAGGNLPTRPQRRGRGPMADRKRRFALGGFVLSFFLVAMSGLAGAATITVDTLADPTGVSGTCSLPDPVTHAHGKNQPKTPHRPPR